MVVERNPFRLFYSKECVFFKDKLYKKQRSRRASIVVLMTFSLREILIGYISCQMWEMQQFISRFYMEERGKI
jgi:hypothetical protein